MDRLIFEYLNLLREDPVSVYSELKTLFELTEAHSYNINNVYDKLYEGGNANLDALEWSDGLYLAARDHCLDMAATGLTG
jgi:uncharacterized protein YkwD